ncbi:MAG: antirestriction protein ArdA [Clostridia bacterium]|nr:antirestriction protein ArdA [Clostridia bacterium]
MNNINIVIGSWGSYNECNNRALGSKWLDLSDYSSYEEIEDELKKEGFDLDGIDEELFIQDIDGLPSDCCNWDYTHPKDLFELLQEADVIDNDYKYDLMNAYLEVRNFDDFKQLVNDNGSRWDDDIHYYKGYDWSDYGREMFDCCGYQIPEQIENFIDFEAYGKYMGDYYAEEISTGILEIVR